MDYTINQAAEPPADDPNANTANYDASADEGSFILPEVTTVMSDVNNFFQAQLLPRCREIESEVNALTYEANAVTNRAEVEKQEVVKELSRLSELVLSFQQRIQQFLHFGSFQG